MALKLDNLRENVKLMEITTNKLIKADAMSTKTPQIINIKDSYESIFEDERKIDEGGTPEEIARIFRSMMKNNKNKD